MWSLHCVSLVGVGVREHHVAGAVILHRSLGFVEP